MERTGPATRAHELLDKGLRHLRFLIPFTTIGIQLNKSYLESLQGTRFQPQLVVVGDDLTGYRRSSRSQSQGQSGVRHRTDHFTYFA